MIEITNDCNTKIEYLYENNDYNSKNLKKILFFSCFLNEFCKNRKIFRNSICTFNCLKKLNEIDDIDGIFFENEQYKLIFYKESTEILRKLSKFLNKLAKFEIKIKNYDFSCINHKICSKNHDIFIKRIFGDDFRKGILYSNPIKAYFEIKNEIKVIKSLINKNSACKNCINYFLKYLEKLTNSFQKQEFIKKFLILSPNEKKVKFEEIYSKILQFKLINKEEIGKIQGYEYFENNNLIDQYLVDPYLIQIYKDELREEPIYIFSKPNKKIDLSKEHLKEIKIFDEKLKFFKLDELIKYNIEKFTRYFKENKLNYKDNNEELIKILSFENLGLNKLIPFLLDSNIEEIFLDSIKSNIYIDHSKFGRCYTNIRLNYNDIENFKTRIRLENNSLLDEKHPQLKTDLYTEYFNVRISCNINPLAVDKINFSIRKLRKKMFSIIELINFNTITVPIVAYLCFLLFHKRNIIVIGSPGAGKTTLINSLDLLTPSSWRKIYLEDVIESIDQFNFGKHQVRFHVTSKMQKDNLLSKNVQVRETLHRTPDMIFIGELIHKETVQAFFFLLKTGLRCGLGTCHGESPKLIIQRWLEDDDIPLNSIKNIDVIVQIAKTDFGRRIIKISEIGEDKELKENYIIRNIFLRDPINDSIKPNFNSLEELFNQSPVINKIKNLLIEDISKEKFADELKIYQNFIELLKNNEISELNDIVFYFNKFWAMKLKFQKNYDLFRSELTNIFS